MNTFYIRLIILIFSKTFEKMLRPTLYFGIIFCISIYSTFSCPARNLCIQKPIEITRSLSFFNDTYCGCRHILGSLTIRLEPDSPELEESSLSFLNQLEEVTDYIYLVNVKITRLVIPRLRIIGGRNPIWVTVPGQVQNYALLFQNCSIDQIILPKLTYIESNTVGTLGTNENVYSSDIFRELLAQTTGCNLYGLNWREILRRTSIQFRIDIQSLSTVPAGTIILDLASDCNRTSIMSQCNGCIGNRCWNQTECQALTSTFSGLGCTSCVVESGCYDLGQCCNRLCLGGCSGPGPDQCYGCRQFDNNNLCVSECPQRFVFNPISFTNEFNPDGRLTLDKFCVQECLLGDIVFQDRECVERCPETFTVVTRDGVQVCEFCGTACPSECNGTDVLPDGRLKSINAHLFENCTRINGDIVITQLSYTLDGVTENELRYLETITEITGRLTIANTPENISAFTFLRNLRIIRGNGVSSTGVSLAVTSNNFEYIDLSQLQTVSAGRIGFALNTNLCYLANLTVYRPEDQIVLINPDSYPNDPNCTCDEECQPLYRCWGPGPTCCVRCRNFIHDRTCVTNCSGMPKVYSDFSSKTCKPCNTQCLNSCTDPTALSCDACVNFKYENKCVELCSVNHYSDEQNICIQCHSVCTMGCTGPNTTISEGGCNLCERIELDENENEIGCIQGDRCQEYWFERIEIVADVIPVRNTSTNINIKVCRPCHSLCLTCNGKEIRNCTSCRFFNGTSGVCVESCDNTTEYGIQGECRLCDQECIGCTGQTARNCLRCKNVFYGGECLEKCPMQTYPVNNSNCSHCHSSCETCQEAGEYGCTSCDLTRVLTYWNTSNATCTVNCFNGFYRDERNCSRCGELCRVCTSLEDCTSCLYAQLENRTCVRECPENFILDDNGIFCTPNTISSSVESLDRFKYYIGAAFFIGLIIIVVTISCFSICIFVYLRNIKGNKIKQEKELEILNYGVIQNRGIERNDMGLHSSADSQESIAEADMTQLVIASLSSIEKQNALGKGTFGIVYQGIWKLKDGQEVLVAIKELNEDAPIEDMQELIKEAVLLAKMRHKYLVQFYCLCMARQLMIINELVSGGSLVDYLKKETLSSKTRLTYMQQIASGMNYLESRRLVHRDLAARNCLVASNELVKISDFGLSRILDVGENQYTSSGGKIPLRWMPLESVFYKEYSHKSDVWSYGVTAWEILTTKRPYVNIKPQAVVEMLVAGGRLEQPVNCSIDLYALLGQCWEEKPEDRISFEDLKTKLHDMLSEAELYVFPSEEERHGSPVYCTIADYEEIDAEMMAYLVTMQHSVQI